MNENHQSKTHVFYSPTKIIVGLNSASQVAQEVKQFGGSRVLIVTDPGVVAADLIAPIASSLIPVISPMSFTRALNLSPPPGSSIREQRFSRPKAVIWFWESGAAARWMLPRAYRFWRQIRAGYWIIAVSIKFRKMAHR